MARDYKIAIPLTHAEYALAQQVAAARGMPVATVLRAIFLESPEARKLRGIGNEASDAPAIKRRQYHEALSRSFYAMRDLEADNLMRMGRTLAEIAAMRTYAEIGAANTAPGWREYYTRAHAELEALGGVLPQAAIPPEPQSSGRTPPSGLSDPFDSFSPAEFAAACDAGRAKL